MTGRVKRIVVSIVVIALLLIYLIRVKQVNELIPKVKEVYYDKGAVVEFDEDILMDYTMKGYSIKVNDAQVLTYTDFLEKYGAEDEYSYVPDKIYDVNVTLYNDDAEDDVGVNLCDFYVQKYSAMSGLDPDMLTIANPEFDGATAIALRKDSSIDINLTFGLYEYQYSGKVWDKLENYDMNLVVTLYPTKKVIALT